MSRKKEQFTEPKALKKLAPLEAHVSRIDAEALASAILYHRKKSRLTQLKLALLADVGKTVIYDLEKGKKSVQLNTLQKVLGVLGIEIYFRSRLMESFLKAHKGTQ